LARWAVMPLPTKDGGQLWLQNAGFIWVPFIIASTVLAWFGMNDIADAKASFAEQAVIFQRKHNWLMCWLYTGTFGSFIGFSAGLPLLAKSQFPDVNVLKYVFLGPLVGAISRAATGWVADRWGGARVTFWVFIGMIAGALGVIHFLEAKDFSGFLAPCSSSCSSSRGGQCLHLPDDPQYHASGSAAADAELDAAQRTRQAEKESAAIVGFTSAIAAYGAFFIPRAFGMSISATGRRWPRFGPSRFSTPAAPR
jgi:NNP family nitrate/nitrite transporter-like MFS transporter